MNQFIRMIYHPHRQCSWYASEHHIRNFGYPEAMETEVLESQLAMKEISSKFFASHFRQLASDLFIFEAFQKWFQGSRHRNCESFARPALRCGEGDRLTLKIDALQWDLRFPESAACGEADFKSDAHPFRLIG